MPSSIIDIKENAFEKCKSLLKVIIPPLVIKNRENVFSQCSSLKKKKFNFK